MKRVLLLFVVNLVLVLIQTSLFLELFGARFNPNLVLAFALVLFAYNKTATALLSCLIGGVLIDLSGVGILGLTPFIFVILMLILSYARQHLFRSFILKIIASLVFPFVYSSVINFGNEVDIALAWLSSFTTLIAFLLLYTISGRILDEARSF